MIRSFRHKGLEGFFRRGTKAGELTGEVLSEYLPEGVSIGEVAKRLGVTRQALSALLNGRAGVSAPMALRLEGALGASAEIWLNMQTNHDRWRARKRPPRVQRMSASNGAA